LGDAKDGNYCACAAAWGPQKRVRPHL
jgi:hypothetical protein